MLNIVALKQQHSGYWSWLEPSNACKQHGASQDVDTVCSFCYQVDSKSNSYQFFSFQVMSFIKKIKWEDQIISNFLHHATLLKPSHHTFWIKLIQFPRDYIVAGKGLSERRQFRSAMDWQDGRQRPAMLLWREVYQTQEGGGDLWSVGTLELTVTHSF